MKAHYKTQTQAGRLTFEVEGQTPKDMFRGIAEIEQIFDADPTCGCCNSANIGRRVRVVDDNDYYELYCKDCTATLTFHQNRTGGRLYLKWDQRKEQNRGWKVWGQPAAAGAAAGQPAPADGEF